MESQKRVVSLVTGNVGSSRRSDSGEGLFLTKSCRPGSCYLFLRQTCFGIGGPASARLSQVSKVNDKDPSAGVETIDYALSVLKDIDDDKNLHKGAAVLVFVASGTMGVFVFFLTLDLTKWLELDVVEPWMQISLPYVLIIVVWIFSFLLIQSALYSMGFRDLASVAKDRLSGLNLSSDELVQLRRDVEVQEHKHKNIF